MQTILKSPENCWRIEPAKRVSFIVDSCAYFQAVREACERAEHSIFILGWDFDRREPLGRGDDAKPMGEFLLGLLKRRPKLHIFLLIWDFNIIYTAERELLQELRLKLKGHKRLHIRLDNHHPVGASQHQKIAVVDDAIAFSGGIDLSRWRWDTPEHEPDSPLRIDPNGNPYPPFHDLMMLVDGEAAEALAGLVRERWQYSGSNVSAPAVRVGDAEAVWPPSVPVTLEEQPVAISRTFPQYEERDAVHEVQRLFIDSIAAAEEYIYIENQYFTGAIIVDALVKRLMEEEGPELILVLPRHTGGWLEQVTMDVLRQHALSRLREADTHNRLRVYYPHQPGLGKDCISVHGKLTIIDDRFVRIGSANTSSRSMGLDSECDLSVEVSGSERQKAVREFLYRLLAEHLGVEQDQIIKARENESGLIGTIESLRREEGRSLRAIPEEHKDIEEILPEDELIDPPEPINPDYFIRYFLPKEHQLDSHQRINLFIGLVVVLLGLAAAWRWGPLGDWLGTEQLASLFGLFDDPVLTAVFVTVLIATVTLVMVPLSLAIVVAGLVLDPITAFISSLIGAVLSGLIAFLIGNKAHGSMLQQLAGKRLHSLSKELSKKGIITVALLRLVPVAPYTIVNLVAGASHLRLLPFILGTILGLIPGVLALTLFSSSLYDAMIKPKPENIMMLVAVVFGILLVAMALRRLIGSRRS